MDMAISNVTSLSPAVMSVPSAKISEASTESPKESITLDPEAVKQSLAAIQSQLQSMNIGISFTTYGGKSANIAVIVTDKDTGQVIREIPPQELQDLYTKLSDLIGIIFNHKV